MEFRYLASDRNGKRVSAISVADSFADLVSRLKNQGLVPLRISPIKVAKKFQRGKIWGARVTGRELASFTRQLATVLNAGILLTDALNTIADDMEHLYFRGVIKEVVNDINAGQYLSQALARYPKIFSSTFIAVVKSGEQVGNLASTLAGLAKYLEDFERMKAKLKSALRYPIFLSCFLVFVVAVIVLFLIPKFKTIFISAGVKLPLLTRIVVGISEFCLKNIPLIIIVALLFSLLWWYLLKIPKIRFSFDSSVLRLAIIGQIIRKALISRFCRTFSILLAGGVGINSALGVAGGVVNNVFLKQIFDEIRNGVISGIPLSEAMKPHETLPRTVFKMVAVGEKSGSLDDMLRRTADYYDEELGVTLDNFSALIEPIFIILIGMVVLVVVLALYLPIFKMSSAVR